jgi:hypothetical protein
MILPLVVFPAQSIIFSLVLLFREKVFTKLSPGRRRFAEYEPSSEKIRNSKRPLPPLRRNWSRDFRAADVADKRPEEKI